MAYCTCADVKAMFGDISDEPTEAIITIAIDNSVSWIEHNLKKNYVPIPVTDVGVLKTVAIYHSVSDVLLSLYHGDGLPENWDVWFNKAQTLLDDYIDSYLNSEATEEELTAHQMVKHSHAQTYSQRRSQRRWVR